MKVSRKNPTLKPKTVSSFRAKIEVKKRHLIYQLMQLAPKSLPHNFREYLKFVLQKVIADGKHEHDFRAKGFDFGNVHEFHDQIRLLKESWKDQVTIVVGQPITSAYWCRLEYLPAN